jgi:chloramphenicol O-acetyltransferase type A
MKVIDLGNWPGRKHYLWFKDYAHPYYAITSRIIITKFRKFLKDRDLPFFISFLYLIVKALNNIKEFRLRIDGDRVILFDCIHPAFTVMTDSGIYDNCHVEMAEFMEFLKKAKESIEAIKSGRKKGPSSYQEESRLDQYYLTCLPWIDFTSVSHPMTDDPKDTIPRIAWGKFIEDEKDTVISLSIQVNHALIDGYPLSLAFLKIQEMLDQPEKFLI